MLIERVASASGFDSTAVARVLRAMADLVEDRDTAEAVVGAAAEALVERLAEQLGGSPTCRQVEELALAHVSVAARLCQLADEWEDESTVPVPPDDSVWKELLSEWGETEAGVRGDAS